MKVNHVVLNTLGCQDSNDDKFLETALVGNTDSLVRGDRDFLVLRQIGSILVLSVADFLSNFL